LFVIVAAGEASGATLSGQLRYGDVVGLVDEHSDLGLVRHRPRLELEHSSSRGPRGDVTLTEATPEVE
jgi:hypothetical protein